MNRDPSSDWRWWGRVVVRAAGFPAAPVLQLSSDSLSESADRNEPTFSRVFDDVQAELSTNLQRLILSDGIQSAILIQNRAAYVNNIQPFLSWDPHSSSRKAHHRKWEMLAAGYIQRYLVKNDTIGFFGPVGWARWGVADRSVQSPGRHVVAPGGSTVYFEPWAVDALAEQIMRMPGADLMRKPKTAAFLWVVEAGLMSPAGFRQTITDIERAVLRLCNGQKSVRDIAKQLQLSESSVSVTVDSLSSKRMVNGQPQLGTSPRPEDALRDFVAEFEDLALREPAQEMLRHFVRLRDQVAGVLAHPSALGERLADLDEHFSFLTGANATRNEGKAYGGRSIIYVDSRRDIAVELGLDLRAQAAPIQMLADAARWLCWHVSEVARKTLELGDEDRRDLTSFWFERLPRLRAAVSAALPQLEAQLLDKWAEILKHDPNASRVQYAYGDVAVAARSAFAVPWAGWAGAKYFSPDVMISSDGSGSGFSSSTLVVGEVHVAINTQRAWCFTTQLPPGEDLFEELNIDAPEPVLIVATPRESQPRLTVRTQNSLVRDSDFIVEIAHHASRPNGHGVISGHDVWVIDGDDRVEVELPSGHRFDIMDTFSEVLMDLVIDRLSLVAHRAHTPRITVGSLVVSRETWRFDVIAMSFARVRDEAGRFRDARKWMRDVGLPRHVFVSSRGEKPVFIDFASPALVNLLCRLIRTSPIDGSVQISEMLPAIGTEWIKDHSGAGYTSELRFTLVDQMERPSSPRR